MGQHHLSTPFRVYNSLTRQIDILKSSQDNILNWYVCGPTVYDNSHLGHARTYMSCDIMRRIIVRYGNGINVKMLMGITDVDDKIITRASQSGTSTLAVARLHEHEFINSLKRLGIKLPDRFTRVSENIENIIEFIEHLVRSGFAYQSEDGSVYFSIKVFIEKGFKYPKFRTPSTILSEIPPSDLGKIVKKERRDFALWKGAKTGEPSWKSPWGAGRPGWHIECSSMIHSVFGSNVDLHSGGIDLEFPHHENEIAQSEAFYGRSPWCPHFIHYGSLLINDEKMSKSLGNYVTITKFLDRFRADDMRMLCLLSNYRSPLLYTEEKLVEAAGKFDRLSEFLCNMEKISLDSAQSLCRNFVELDTTVLLRLESFRQKIEQAFKNDFDWPAVLQSLFVGLVKDVVAYTNQQGTEAHPLVLMHIVDEVRSLMSLFGFTQKYTQNLQFESKALIEEAVQFRGRVRTLGLKQLKAGNYETARETLHLCDNFRQIISHQGDGDCDGGSPSWSWSSRVRVLKTS